MSAVATTSATASATTRRVPWQAKFLALSLIWGSSFLLMKFGLRALAPIQIAALRIAFGAAIVYALLRASGARLPRSASTWGHIFVASIFLTALPFTLFALGGVAQIEREAADPGSEFWMGIAGPIASAAVGFLCLGVAQFFDFLSDAKVQSESHKRTGYLPITMAAYKLTEESGFYKEKPGTDVAVTQMIRKTTDKSRGIRLGNFVQIRTIVDEETEQIWSGKKTAKEALDAAVKRGDEQLERFQKANKG